MGTASRVMVVSSPKIVSEQMAAPVPEIMGGFFYTTFIYDLRETTLLK
jgi:hypothetical protein